jgi:hypothetical protein
LTCRATRLPAFGAFYHRGLVAAGPDIRAELDAAIAGVREAGRTETAAGRRRQVLTTVDISHRAMADKKSNARRVEFMQQVPEKR